jgi:hypothetical protein
MRSTHDEIALDEISLEDVSDRVGMEDMPKQDANSDLPELDSDIGSMLQMGRQVTGLL